MKITYLPNLLQSCLLALSLSVALPGCSTPPNVERASVKDGKEELRRVRAKADRASGVVQLTGKELVRGQTKFPGRTPADPVAFVDEKTGEVFVYGTQVEGTGFSYLKYKDKNDLLRGAPGELISRDVYLPNGEKMVGKEAIWDTYRLPYQALTEVFSEKSLVEFYERNRIRAGSDLYFGGVALQEDGALGRWTQDNWRRRVHPIAEIDGRLQILRTPVFNPIRKGASETDHPGFGRLPFLPGNYIGHAYGPNFKIVDRGQRKELWIISEEVTRRVGKPNPVEVTEILARRMKTPVLAERRSVLLASVNDDQGKPHPDSNRGKEMAHTKLIEGFRPTSLTAEGIRITKRAVRVPGGVSYITDRNLAKREYFFLAGSPGNFAGDDYDVILSVREKSAIGFHEIIREPGSTSWKRYLSEIKRKYRLSWAGRGSFLRDDSGDWWLLFHGVDKDLKPDGSYGGVIPPNTEEYHRNLYAVPVDFVINEEGKPDMRVLL